MRYYDKDLRTEVNVANANTLTDTDIAWWFEELPTGKMIDYAKDGTPTMVDIVLPVVDPIEMEKSKLRNEMNTILGDMTPAESMLLMLKYGFEKMQPNGGSSDAPVPSTPLTPTGEDLITWGDRVAQELEDKLVELRKL